MYEYTKIAGFVKKEGNVIGFPFGEPISIPSANDTMCVLSMFNCGIVLGRCDSYGNWTRPFWVV